MISKQEQAEYIKEVERIAKEQRERFLKQDLKDCFRNVSKCNCNKKLKYCKG